MKMLCLFDYGKNVNTGYATVSRNLVQYWMQHIPSLSIDIVGINFFEAPYEEYEGRVKVQSALLASKDDPTKFPQFIDPEGKWKNDEYGMVKAPQMLKNNSYDIFFALNDIGVLSKIGLVLKRILRDRAQEKRSLFKSVAYFPVDTFFYGRLFDNMEAFDRLVTYNQFGKDEVSRLRPELKCEIIPHGTNITDFFPLEPEQRKKFRQEYFKKNSGKFIVGNINRNQPRKDIPATILGFLEFKTDVPEAEAILYLHTNPEDPNGHDLLMLLEQTSLVVEKNVIFPPQEYWEKGAPQEMMNNIYNALDVYVTTHRGEGWGLSITEAMCCKVPVIAPLHTSVPEISDEGGTIFPLREFDEDVSTFDNMLRYKCLAYEVGTVLSDVYKLNKQKSRMLTMKTDAAYSFIRPITWDKSAQSFIDIFNQLIPAKNE
jgi:glycosyltransferase involved in cell wall biosynthesis